MNGEGEKKTTVLKSVVSLTGAEHCNAQAAVAAVSALLGGIFTFIKEWR